MKSIDILSSIARSAAFACSVLMLTGVPALAEPFDIGAAYEACLEQPEYAIGGAMAGDCMIDQSEILDLAIETAITRAGKNFCTAADRDAIAASQAAWTDYRESYCTLIETSPGNTGSWINAGACRLDLTQQRLNSLVFLTDHAYSWCHDMHLVGALSHFGDPAGLERSNDEAGIAWSTRDDGDRRFIDIALDFAGQREVVEITSCSYCTDGKDCDDGLFVFAGATGDGGTSHAVAHLCTMGTDGALLEILGPLPADAPERTSFAADGHIGWIVEDGSLRITVDGDDHAAWSFPSGS